MAAMYRHCHNRVTFCTLLLTFVTLLPACNLSDGSFSALHCFQAAALSTVYGWQIHLSTSHTSINSFQSSIFQSVTTASVGSACHRILKQVE